MPTKLTEADRIERQSLSHELRRVRIGLKLSIKEAAEILQCHKAYVSGIETGSTSFRPRRVREMIRRLRAGVRQQKLAANKAAQAEKAPETMSNGAAVEACPTPSTNGHTDSSDFPEITIWDVRQIKSFDFTPQVQIDCDPQTAAKVKSASVVLEVPVQKILSEAVQMYLGVLRDNHWGAGSTIPRPQDLPHASNVVFSPEVQS